VRAAASARSAASDSRCLVVIEKEHATWKPHATCQSRGIKTASEHGIGWGVASTSNAVNSAPSRYQPLSAYALKPRLLRCPCRGVAFAPPAPLASCTLGHSMRESCCPILNSPWRSPERPPRLAIAGCGAVSLVWQVVVYCAFFLKTNLYIV
jgi:hypothetical protein